MEAGILLVIDGVVIVSVATDSGLPGEGSVLAERGEQCARSPSQRLHLQVSLPLALLPCHCLTFLFFFNMQVL